MSWITLTTDDVLTKWAGPELEAAQTAALASGQSDPIPEIIAQVIREIRGYVAACSRNTLGDGATIPDELLGEAITRIRYEAATRLPGGALLDDDRRAANTAAVAKLREVAACRFSLEQPATESAEVISAPASPRWKARARQFTRAQQDGL